MPASAAAATRPKTIRLTVVPPQMRGPLYTWAGLMPAPNRGMNIHDSIATYRPADRRTHGLAGQDVRQRPQDRPRGRPRDHRGMEVDGKPGVVARRHHRGLQR